jgi:hypothetical protein
VNTGVGIAEFTQENELGRGSDNKQSPVSHTSCCGSHSHLIFTSRRYTECYLPYFDQIDEFANLLGIPGQRLSCSAIGGGGGEEPSLASLFQSIVVASYFLSRMEA